MPTKRSLEFVDLTGDDNVEPPAQVQRQTHAPSDHGSAEPTQRDVWPELDEEGAADDIIFAGLDGQDNSVFSFQLYGILDTKIVGVQYYRGLANPGEYVILRRQPSNQYDSNAICVENVQRQQIGHIPRDVAKKLAPYIDKGDLKMEGSLAGRIAQYDCPITLKLFGTSDPIERADLRSRMKTDRLPTQIVDEKERDAKKRKAEELKKIAAAKKAKGKKRGQELENQMGFAGAPPSQGDGIPGQSMDEMVENARSFNPRDIGGAAEKFGLDEEALAALPMADSPAKLATELLPYQRQAVSAFILFTTLDH